MKFQTGLADQFNAATDYLQLIMELPSRCKNNFLKLFLEVLGFLQFIAMIAHNCLLLTMIFRFGLFKFRVFRAKFRIQQLQIFKKNGKTFQRKLKYNKQNLLNVYCQYSDFDDIVLHPRAEESAVGVPFIIIIVVVVVIQKVPTPRLSKFQESIECITKPKKN